MKHSTFRIVGHQVNLSLFIAFWNDDDDIPNDSEDFEEEWIPQDAW